MIIYLDKGKVCTRKNTQKQLIIPRALTEEVMLSLHEEITSGDLSVENTYLRIKARYYWIGMYTKIQRWCTSCVDCAMKKSPGSITKALLQPILVDSGVASEYSR